MKFLSGKLKAKILELYGSAVIAPSVIFCKGSKRHSDCRLPLTITLEQAKLRDKIVSALLDSENQGDKELGAELNEICFFCMADHPEVKPYIPKIFLRALPSARAIAAQFKGE